MTTALRPLTISITTRNRHDRVIECLRSLLLLKDLIAEILVLDDMSEQPLEPLLRSALTENYPLPITVFREEVKIGWLQGRNKLARAAKTDFIFNLDDDTVILEAAGVQSTLGLMERDPKVAAVGFAQGDLDGTPYQPGYQPATVDYPCQVGAFTGYAYIVRRLVFVEKLGGYQELIGLYGEEKDFGLRALDAGYVILYLPAALVAHHHDKRGRDHQLMLRQTVQSSCLQFVINQPLILVVPGIVARLALYQKERRIQGIHDFLGTFFVLGQVLLRLPAALRRRKPVRWSTLKQWRAIRRSPPRYPVSIPSGNATV